MTKTKSRLGFTLVEMMIVVVIIGFLAAIAVPGFQKIRATSVASAMDNDARQLASAAQQYFLEEGVINVPVVYSASSGQIAGPLADRVGQISKRYTTVVESDSGGLLLLDDGFKMEHALVGSRTYTPGGQYALP